jgi:hypothetical protein
MWVHSGTHLYARSDLICHGTSQLHAALVPPSQRTPRNVPRGQPVLVGFALFTKRNVLADSAMRFFHGAAKTAAAYTRDAWELPNEAARRHAAQQQLAASRSVAQGTAARPV